MRKRRAIKLIKSTIAAVLISSVLLLSMCGCASAEASQAKSTADLSVSVNAPEAASGSLSATKTNTSGYVVPEFRNAVYNASKAEGNKEAKIDISSVEFGYVAVNCPQSDKRIKFQVLKDDLTVTYNVETGKDQIFPLQSGDGHYVFRVMKNVQDSKYAELYRTEADVKIKDEFDPFLRPNQYAEYTEGSNCVKKASEFAKDSKTQEDLIAKIYDYVVTNVKYDEVKAKSVKSGYIPDPDETLKTNKGICFDYASLAASMMRSQGIPTKIIFGYVAPNDLYHAWNMFYTEKDGWRLAEFKVTGKDWNRIDLTFYAGNASAQFIGDGSNYLEAYCF